MENNQTQGANRAGRTIHNPSDPISRYNLVMRCYNRPYHRVNSVALTPLPAPACYRWGFRITRLKYAWLLLVLYLLPYANFAVLLWMGFLWLMFERAYKVASKNSVLVPNALQNMVLSASVCSLFHLSNVFLRLTGDQITTTLDLSRRRVADNEFIVMFYNEGFRAWYSEFHQWRYHHLLHVLLGVFFLVVVYGLVYPAFGFDPIGVSQLRNSLVQ